MKTLIVLGVLTVLILIYALGGRAWLKRQPWMQWWFASKAGEWVEINIWKKSESILWFRGMQFIGLLVPLLQAIGAFDITPFMAIIPEGYGPYCMVLIFVCGQIGEWLRKKTTKPLELVAIPENPPMEVAVAVAQADSAKAAAVAVTAEAKAAGEV